MELWRNWVRCGRLGVRWPRGLGKGKLRNVKWRRRWRGKLGQVRRGVGGGSKDGGCKQGKLQGEVERAREWVRWGRASSELGVR